MTPMTRSNALAKISAIRASSDELQTMLGIFDEMLFHDCARGDFNKLMLSMHKALELMFGVVRGQFYELHGLISGNGDALAEALACCEGRVFEGECILDAMGALVRQPLDQDGRFKRFMEASHLGIRSAVSNFQRQITRVAREVKSLRLEAAQAQGLAADLTAQPRPAPRKTLKKPKPAREAVAEPG